MIGAIAGDIIGSVYEANPIKTKEFPLFHPQSRFTDDTVLTVAVAKAIMEDGDYLKAVITLGRRYPHAGYGGMFLKWLYAESPTPYNSWGNGSAMRVSPVGFAFDTIEDVLEQAALTAQITHNHPEGIKGAQCAALAVFLSRTTRNKSIIKQELTERFDYNFEKTLAQIRPTYGFDVSYAGTVPQAIIAFLESVSHEDAIRNAISLGGDSDTLACITGGIAEAFYGFVDPQIVVKVKSVLPEELWLISERFRSFLSKGH